MLFDSSARAAARQGPRGPSSARARPTPPPRRSQSDRASGAVLALVTCLAFAPAATAAPPLATRLAQALAVPGISTAQSSAIAIDLATGQTLFARNADRSLAPASNEKLTVTYAALVELGTSYRFRTEVLGVGSQEGNVVARRRLPQGLRRPDAHVAGARAARGAVDGARHHAHRRARARRRVVVRRAAHGAGLEGGVLHQRVAAALGARRRPRPVRRPHRATARARRGGPVRAACCAARDHRGRGRSRPRACGRVRARAGRVASRCRTCSQEMDRDSDNFMAELLLKELGAEAGDSGHDGRGRRASCCATSRTPACRSQACGSLDGSGLSLDDRLTARALATLLVVAWNDVDLRNPFWAALPVAGVNGTLEDRMQTRAGTRRRAREDRHDEPRVGAVGLRARPLRVRGHAERLRRCSTWSARKAQDRFATALASTL